MPRTPKAPKPPRPITPQKIWAVLRKAGLPKSDGYIVSQQPHGWMVYTSYWTQDAIIVRCEHHPKGCNILYYYLDVLATAGIVAEVHDGAVWVAVDQAPDQAPHTGDTRSMEPKHPIQPLIKDEHGIIRFKQNAIVRFLLDAGPFDLNQLGLMQFSDEDREQFAQLIGYSKSGFSELSYVSDETWAIVPEYPDRRTKPMKELELMSIDEIADQIDRLASGIFDIVPLLNEVNRRMKINTMAGNFSRDGVQHLSTSERYLFRLTEELRRLGRKEAEPTEETP